MPCAVRWLIAALGLVSATNATSAQNVGPAVSPTSAWPAPESVAVTIYRAPDRSAAVPIDRDWLQGYALITEQRRVAIPAGRTTLRFEGVAAGILPESAIVTGLPHGVREKNLDADLLSPRSLYANGFGRPVTIRRSIAKKTVEEAGIIRSGPDGAAILQTRAGFVALDCGPGHERLVYDHLPSGLTPKPTLSVQLDSPTATIATVTLSYLAWGFDWQANYVATLHPEGQSADLFAWVTLASSDTTSFAQAETMVVAGKVAREDDAPYPGQGQAGTSFTLQCFANPIEVGQAIVRVESPPPPAPMAEAMDIVVTGSRRMAPRLVEQEDLGDLKLYRVPDRTTVAALAQKQVALLDRQSVPISIVYVTQVDADGDVAAPVLTLRALNRKDRGLGVPLPAGPVAVFQPRGGTALLIGEGAIADKAVGEEVEARIAAATQVTVENASPAHGKGWQGHVLTVRNANPYPIRFEAQFDADSVAHLSHLAAKLTRKDAKQVWAVTVPANSARTLDYRSADRD